jgi:hypothetical protein
MVADDLRHAFAQSSPHDVGFDRVPHNCAIAQIVSSGPVYRLSKPPEAHDSQG